MFYDTLGKYTNGVVTPCSLDSPYFHYILRTPTFSGHIYWPKVLPEQLELSHVFWKHEIV